MNSKSSHPTRFLMRLAAFLSIQVAIASVVAWYGSPQNSRHYFSAMHDKIACLNRCAGPRLILVGGSNVAFGIHSPHLQRATGLQTVNLGLHAALGLDYTIECAAGHAREGDVVVLIPEYEVLIGDIQDGDPTTINQLLVHYPMARHFFDPSRYDSWRQFLDRDALCRAHQWVIRAYDRIRKGDRDDKIYQRRSFNQQGDVVAHYGKTPDRVVTKTLPEIDPERLNTAVARLNRLAQRCRERGVDVYLTFPPLPDRTYMQSESTVRRVQHELRQRLDLPILRRPEDFVFPADQFFDTGDHLGERAGRQRTEVIANALLQERQRVRQASRQDGQASRL